MALIRDLLYAEPAHVGFDVTGHPDDLQGWGSDHAMFRQLIEQVRPTRILEVGSWKGRSAINMARVVRELGLATEIVCVDTWLGSSEHWLAGQPSHWLHADNADMFQSLRISHGLPGLYQTFLANVIRAGVADIITPFPINSDNAAAVFKELGVRFDLIYLDGAHDYEAVHRDLCAFWPLVSVDGVLFGDDYGGWPGVTAAVDEFAGQVGASLDIQLDKFALRGHAGNARPPEDRQGLALRLHEAEQSLAHAQRALAAVHDSTSWRITQPLRGLRAALRRP